MIDLQRGIAPPKKSKARTGTLSLREPHVESLVAGLDLDIDMAELRRFCKAWTVDRSRWDIERRRHGLFSGRIKKADADAALKRAFKALEGGGE